MDSLDKKAHLFFKQCKRDELQHESMDTEFHSLRGEYFKVMEDADEKVAIATQIHELVERYLRRLDSELFKFKCELEADNNGITEILERRSLELDGNSTAATALLLSMNQKENRYYGASSANCLVNSSTGHASGVATGPSAIALVSGAAGTGGALSSISTAQLSSSQRHRKLEKRRETICTVPVQEKRPNLNHSLPVVGAGVTTASAASSSSATAAATVVGLGNVSSAQSQASNHIGSVAATHLTLPVAVGVTGGGSSLAGSSLTTGTGSLVRQLPTNLAHSVMSSSGGAATAVAAGGASTPVVTAGSGHGHAHSGHSAGGATVTYNLQQLGGGAAASSAIAAAASQAIVATQQMQQGRRTASLKASYEAIHGTAGTTAEFWTQAGQSGMQPSSTGSVTVAAGTALATGGRDVAEADYCCGRCGGRRGGRRGCCYAGADHGKRVIEIGALLLDGHSANGFAPLLQLAVPLAGAQLGRGDAGERTAGASGSADQGNGRGARGDSGGVARRAVDQTVGRTGAVVAVLLLIHAQQQGGGGRRVAVQFQGAALEDLGDAVVVRLQLALKLEELAVQAAQVALHQLVDLGGDGHLLVGVLHHLEVLAAQAVKLRVHGLVLQLVALALLEEQVGLLVQGVHVVCGWSGPNFRDGDWGLFWPTHSELRGPVRASP